jgi:molybdopterin-guanine dinucleotide biosynthesis protein A
MTLTAILFVGGLSRRMGTDKALLEVNGEPLWHRQIDLLSKLEPESLKVSARERPEWCPPEIEVVLDSPPSRGPLSGLSATLQRLETTHLLALAIDLPRMTAEELRRLWSLAQPGCGVIPAQDDYFEPLCAIYPAETAAHLGEIVSQSDASLQTLAGNLLAVNRLKTYRVPESEKPLFLNANSPSDLDAFQRTA